MTRRFLLKLLALIPFIRRLLEPAPEVAEYMPWKNWSSDWPTGDGAGWDANAPSTPWKSYTGGYAETTSPPRECYGIPYWIEPGKIDKAELLRVLRQHQELW